MSGPCVINEDVLSIAFAKGIEDKGTYDALRLTSKRLFAWATKIGLSSLKVERSLSRQGVLDLQKNRPGLRELCYKGQTRDWDWDLTGFTRLVRLEVDSSDFPFYLKPCDSLLDWTMILNFSAARRSTTLSRLPIVSLEMDWFLSTASCLTNLVRLHVPLGDYEREWRGLGTLSVAKLTSLFNLEDLNLAGVPMDVCDLGALQSLPNLQKLEINVQIEAKGLSVNLGDLSLLPALKHLRLVLYLNNGELLSEEQFLEPLCKLSHVRVDVFMGVVLICLSITPTFTFDGYMLKCVSHLHKGAPLPQRHLFYGAREGMTRLIEHVNVFWRSGTSCLFDRWYDEKLALIRNARRTWNQW